MKNPLNLLIFCFFILSGAFAQEVKFGKITKEELMETKYMQDTSAHAAVLYSYRKSYYDSYTSGVSEMTTEIQKKIKIYDEQGYKYATELINLYKTRSSSERIGRIKAYTYNLENGKIVKTELDKDQVFRNEISYNYDQVKFSMPNVKKGSIIEFKYKINSPYTWNVDEFKFQDEIPIKRIEAILAMPKGFIYKPNYKGYIPFYPKKSSVNNPRLNVPISISTFHLNNVPALKDEIFVDNISNYRAGVVYELVSVQLPTYNRVYAQTWKDVAQSIGNDDDYEKLTKKSSVFKKEITELIDGETNAMKKTKMIFQYVKDNIKWNGIDGKYFYHGPRKALKEKKGNAADINLTLVSMLRFAGVKAHPVVISTKENSIPYYPTLDRLNFVVAYASIDGANYFLDATHEFSDLNVLPIRDYNWNGILINNEDMVWSKISIKEPQIAIGQYQVDAKLYEDGSIDGNYRARFTNHYAKDFRENYKDSNEESFIISRENHFNDIEISDYELKNVDEVRGNVSEVFNYYKEFGAEIVGDKIFIKPMLYLIEENNPFKREERILPIDFGHAFKNQMLINIEIPEGYEIEKGIEPFVMKTPDGIASFKFRPKVIGQKIQLSVIFEVNKAMIGANSYLALKEFFNQVITKENEKIVIKKI